MSILGKKELGALEVSAHWDDLNLSTLLAGEHESPNVKGGGAMPAGMMNLLIDPTGDLTSVPGSMRFSKSPVKVTKEVIVQRHTKQWEKSNHSVLKDRYGAQPHKPPSIDRASLDRLSNPLMGRYSSVEDYEKRVRTAAADNDNDESRAREAVLTDGLDPDASIDRTSASFLTGLDDAELSPSKRNYQQYSRAEELPQKARGAAKGALSGGTFGTNLGLQSNGPSGFFLTATEDASPVKRAAAPGARPGRDALGANTASSRNRGGRVNTFRNKVEEAGRTHRMNQAAGKYRSTARAKTLEQSVLEQTYAGRGVGARGGRGAGMSQGSTVPHRGQIKSSGYGAQAGVIRQNRTSNNIGIGFERGRPGAGAGVGGRGAGRASAAGRGAVGRGAGSSRGRGLDTTADSANKVQEVLPPKRGRTERLDTGRGGRGRSTSRSRGVSSTRGISASRNPSDALKSSLEEAAQKKAEQRAKAQAARMAKNGAASGGMRSSASASQSQSKLRSTSASSVSRNTSSSNVGNGGVQQVGRGAGGGLAAIRERKQVSSAPTARRGPSMERPNSKATLGKPGSRATAVASTVTSTITTTTVKALITEAPTSPKMLSASPALSPKLPTDSSNAWSAVPRPVSPSHSGYLAAPNPVSPDTRAKTPLTGRPMSNQGGRPGSSSHSSRPVSRGPAAAPASPIPEHKSPPKKKGLAVPVSKKDMLKSAASWRPTSDILKSLESVQQSEVQRSKAQNTNIFTPMKADGKATSESPETVDEIDLGKLARAQSRAIRTSLDKENKKNPAVTSFGAGNVYTDASEKKRLQKNAKATDDSFEEESMASVLMAKANRLKNHFDAASKGFAVDEAEALANSLDTGVSSPMKEKMSLKRNRVPLSDRAPLTGRADIDLQRSRDEELLQRMIEADRIVYNEENLALDIL